MTRFADELFDDLMREHGSALAHTRVPTVPKRHPAARAVLLTAGAGGLAVAATVGSLAATVGSLLATGGGTPAYAVTKNSDGTVTLAVYQQSGIAAANAQLHQLGDEQVVVVPVGSHCPSINSLRAPAARARQISVRASSSGDGTVTVDAHGIPAGDILVLGWTATGRGQFSMSQSMTSTSDHASASGKASGGSHAPAPAAGATTAARLTSGPAPSCVSVPPLPPRVGHHPVGQATIGSGASQSQKKAGSSGPTTNTGS
jgi:hypothetical protein